MTATILNVDDYSPGRYGRTKVLQRAGFEVLEASTGHEALRLVERKPDLVLLDINLPDMDGLEICRRIKEDPNTAGTLVLHLTASRLLPEEKVAGLNNGADGYLTEPVDPDVLVATVKALLRAHAAEEALRRSNDDLRNFTNMLSHELREPLRSITAYTELLGRSIRDRLTPTEDEYLAHALGGARRMGEFIDAILLYCRTEQVDSETVAVSAEEVLQDTLTELRLLIYESGARIVNGNLPAVRANRLTLARVFSNLISNSIKYRGTETPVIRVSAERQSDMILFVFRDNGIGIDRRYHSRIFDVFRRLHGSEYPGTGVGLSVCKRIIEHLGGTIWVDSEPGHGSTFYFTLPAA